MVVRILEDFWLTGIGQRTSALGDQLKGQAYISNSLYHLTRKCDHHKWIHKVFAVSHERFGDVSHDAGVHLGEPFSFVDSHIKSGPRPF